MAVANGRSEGGSEGTQRTAETPKAAAVESNTKDKKDMKKDKEGPCGLPVKCSIM